MTTLSWASSSQTGYGAHLVRDAPKAEPPEAILPPRGRGRQQREPSRFVVSGSSIDTLPLAPIGALSDYRLVDDHETGWTASTPLPGETRLRSPDRERRSRRPACSFCGQQDSENRPRPIVTGNGNVAICGDCAELALEILKQ